MWLWRWDEPWVDRWERGQERWRVDPRVVLLAASRVVLLVAMKVAELVGLLVDKMASSWVVQTVA